MDYTLSELGATLLDSVVALGEWATTHRHEINDNRTHYDATHPTQAPS
ncbi:MULTISPECIES: hypothetical protein [Streptomyces]|uniref:HTH hxlR-type domain-containing protein n=2 Tax=Streptomyces TaxID=1883 RepID=A0ABV9IFF3_9ACTN